MNIKVDAKKSNDVMRIYITCGGVELACRRVGDLVDIKANGDGDVESLKAIAEELAEVLK